MNNITKIKKRFSLSGKNLLGGGKKDKARTVLLKGFISFSTLLLFCSTLFAQTWPYTAGNLKFNSNNDGVSCHVSGVDGSPTSVTIPATITNEGHTYNVTYIWGDNTRGAFQGCTSLETVTFETTSAFTEIRQNAFKNCTSLTSITIPSSVTTFGKSVFIGCTALATVTFADGSTLQSIPDETFRNCTALTSIDIPLSVTTIGNNAFGQNNVNGLTSITLHEGITSIGDGAFFKSNLTSVTIPTTVTTIGAEAFRGCSNLATLTFTSSSSLTTIGDKAFLEAGLTGSLVIPDNVTSIGTEAFRKTSITSVTLPAGLTTISDHTFQECTNLSTLTITTPSSITSIGNEAFRKCSALTTANIPSSVTTIGSDAFRQCSNLATLTLNGTNLTTIGDRAFLSCKLNMGGGLAIPSSVTSIGSEAFSGTKLVSVNIPDGVTVIKDRTFQDCTSLTTVTINSTSNLTRIDSFAFTPCPITAIYIPTTVISIGQKAFHNCTSLATITGGGAITYIGIGAFQGDTNLTGTINLAEGLTHIKEYAFDNCRKLTGLTIPSTVTKIDARAFANNKKLTSVTIPAGVTELDKYGTFMWCSNLSVTFASGSSLTNIGEHCFYGSNLGSVALPTSLTTIGKEAFGKCNISSISGLNNVQRIDSAAFENLQATTINLPSIVTICDSAFAGSKLTTVTIGKNIERIEDKAFFANNNLTSFTISAYNPPTLANSNAFDISAGINPSINIYVPCGSASSYKATAKWSDYASQISAQTMETTITEDRYLEDCDCVPSSSVLTIKDGASLSANNYSELASRVSSINVEKNLPVGRWSLIGNLSTSSTTYDILNNNTGNINTSTAHEFVALPFDYSNNSWRYSEDHTYVYSSDATPTNFGSFLAWPLTDEAGVGTETDLSDTYVTLTQNITSLNENTTVSFSGITNTNSPQWFALTNPYIGRLSLSEFKTDNSSAINGNYCYIWNASASDYGNWVSVDMSSETPAAAPATGFFVAGVSSSPTFSFATSQILKGTDHTVLYKSEEIDNKIEFTANANGNKQKVFAQFSDIATNGFDREDSYVMFSTDENDVNPYFLVEGKNLLDNRFNSLPYTSDINFNAYKSDVIDFTLTKVPQGIEVTFINLIDETETILTENEPISLSVVEGANANLYQLRFSKKNVGIDELANEENYISIWTSGKQINISGKDLKRVEIYNTLGQKVYSSRLAGNNILFNSNLNSGAYIIKAYDRSNSKTEKVILK